MPHNCAAFALSAFAGFTVPLYAYNPSNAKSNSISRQPPSVSGKTYFLNKTFFDTMRAAETFSRSIFLYFL